jgi:hypothetical protein
LSLTVEKQEHEHNNVAALAKEAVRPESFLVVSMGRDKIGLKIYEADLLSAAVEGADDIQGLEIQKREAQFGDLFEMPRDLERQALAQFSAPFFQRLDMGDESTPVERVHLNERHRAQRRILVESQQARGHSQEREEPRKLKVLELVKASRATRSAQRITEPHLARDVDLVPSSAYGALDIPEPHSRSTSVRVHVFFPCSLKAFAEPLPERHFTGKADISFAGRNFFEPPSRRGVRVEQDTLHRK